jgi:hypothetical protein
MKSNVEILTPSQTSKSAIPTKQSQTFYPPSGYAGFETFTISPIPSNFIDPEGVEIIEENGEYNIREKNSVKI